MADDTMRAVQIKEHGGPEVMRAVRVPVPQPGRGQVRIKIEACGLNYSDVMIREGFYLDPTPMPYLMGREFCGTIDVAGEGVEGYQPGMRVIGTAPGGAMAEYVVVAAAAGLMPCPEGMEPATGAAIMLQGITAMHCVDDCGRLQAGETLLVHAGAGGVGTLAVQIGLARGAKVFGTASSDDKCRAIADLGGTPINYSTGDWVAELRADTDDRGADVILESVGGAVFRRSLHEALADFGRLVVFGAASGESVELTNIELIETNKTIIGYYLARYIPKYLDRVADASVRLMTLMEQGKLKPIVGRKFPLDKAIDAMNHLQRRESIGKVVITM